jgi:hypothetical protein
VTAEKIIYIIKGRKIIGTGVVSIGHFQALIGPDIHQCQPAFGKLTSLNGLRTD